MAFINLENILGIPSVSSAFLPLNRTCSIWGMFVSCLLPNWAHDSTSINSSFQFSLLYKLDVLEIDTHLKNKLLYIIQLWMWYSGILQLRAGFLPNIWVYVSLLVFKMQLPTGTRLYVVTRSPGIPLKSAEAWANEVRCYSRLDGEQVQRSNLRLANHIHRGNNHSVSLRRHFPIILPEDRTSRVKKIFLVSILSWCVVGKILLDYWQARYSRKGKMDGFQWNCLELKMQVHLSESLLRSSGHAHN